jgi:hypothetical protein
LHYLFSFIHLITSILIPSAAADVRSIQNHFFFNKSIFIQMMKNCFNLSSSQNKTFTMIAILPIGLLYGIAAMNVFYFLLIWGLGIMAFKVTVEEKMLRPTLGDALENDGALGYAMVLTRSHKTQYMRDSGSRNYVELSVSYIVAGKSYRFTFEEEVRCEVGEYILVVYAPTKPNIVRLVSENEMHRFKGYEEHIKNVRDGTGYTNPTK